MDTKTLYLVQNKKKGIYGLGIFVCKGTGSNVFMALLNDPTKYITVQKRCVHTVVYKSNDDFFKQMQAYNWSIDPKILLEFICVSEVHLICVRIGI